jgi:hypothetical protein
MLMYIVAHVEGEILHPVVVADEVSARELIRIRVLDDLQEDMNGGAGDNSATAQLIEEVKKASWLRLCEIMTESEFYWMYQKVDERPDLSERCGVSIGRPCGACSLEKICNDPCMPDVGMMQD